MESFAVLVGKKVPSGTRAIRALSNPCIPIIAMTANAFDEDKQNAFESGMNGHIAKPIDVPALRKAWELLK